VAELAQLPVGRRLLADRGRVEVFLHGAVDHVRSKARRTRISFVLLRIVDLHGVAAAVGDLLLLLFLGQRAVEHLLAVEDRECRLDVVEEPLVVIVADDDERIGVHRVEALGDLVELRLAAIVAFLANVGRILLLELLALAQVVEALEVERAVAEGERGVLAIDVGAQVPFVCRGGQQGSMGCSKPENDLGHARALSVDILRSRSCLFRREPYPVADGSARMRHRAMQPRQAAAVAPLPDA
jgi:hypothetical protein